MSHLHYRDDSDNDSLSQDLSPTDGYFSRREHPQDVYLEQTPSGFTPTAGDAKTSNVSEQFAPSMAASSRDRVYPYRARVENNSPSENTPLLGFYQPPPPTYADAMGTAPRHEYARVGSDRRRSNSPDVEESTGFLSDHGNRQPESMGRPRDLGDDEGLYVVRTKPIWWREWARRRSVKIGLGIIVGVFALALLFAFMNPSEAQDTPKSSPPTNEPEPVKDRPVIPSTTPRPAPNPPLPPIPDPGSPPSWPPYCGKKDENSYTMYREYNERDFRFSEDMHGYAASITAMVGETHFMPAPPEQEANIAVNISITGSAELNVHGIQFTQTAFALEVEGVDFVPPMTADGHCMQMIATVTMKTGLNLDNLDIDSRNTKVFLHEGIGLSVNGLTTVSLSTGSFHSAFFTSRQTKIELGSGSITGNYALLDRLILKTESGQISVGVTAGEKDPEKPKPALFCGHSHSGSVSVRYDVSSLPERDYQTHIEANMGSIDGTFVHGSETKLRALSGSIKVNVVPYNASKTPSELSTYTMSGSTKFNMLSPYSNPGDPLTAIHSTHGGKSGGLTLNYPQEWMGSLQGGTRSGSMAVSGKDVHITREGGGAAGRYIWAEKGSGNSTLMFDTMSGSCNIRVGDV